MPPGGYMMAHAVEEGAKAKLARCVMERAHENLCPMVMPKLRGSPRISITGVSAVAG
jgi:hypothetical protein